VRKPLGAALRERGDLAAALAAYREAIALAPDDAEACNGMAVVHQDQGRLDEAVAAYRHAVALRPDFAMAHSNLLLALHYLPVFGRQEMFEEHRRWNAQHAAPLTPRRPRHGNAADPGRRLRVGLVSGSFRRHPVGYMIVRALEACDREALELVCYTNHGREDDLTRRIRQAVQGWHVITGMDDDDVAAMIRGHGIDVLIDLSGHAADNRLLVFARRPAPVQVKWVGGQVDTTGMDAIDYFLSDAVETPPGDEPWYVEHIVRLPDGYVCYDPPHYAPAVGPLPAAGRGHVTFGCFNNLSKVNAVTAALWARVMHAVPGSRLILKARALNDAEVRAACHAMFERHGLPPDRVELRPASPHPALLETYNEIDIALDPYPYSGGLTTCEALWMGVPVVSLPGPSFAGRHAASHLSNVGLAD
jgi:predicted O-linked N-acetylglucosamine transferase (SPINDLY family)